MRRFALYVIGAVMAFSSSGRLVAQDKEVPTPKEARLQKFWAGYYAAVRDFYGRLDQLDWVAYYQGHGQRLERSTESAKGDNQRIGYAPIMVVPVFERLGPQDLGAFQRSEGTGESASKRGPGPEGRDRAEAQWEFKAVTFGGDAAKATELLNQLGRKGWQYVGPLADGLVAFRRPTRQAAKVTP
jgi:hypothetical protein